MRKIRLRPGMGFFINEKEYERILAVLRKARMVAAEHDVYWDLDRHENMDQVLKGFRYVAAREDIEVDIAAVKGRHSLALTFRKPYIRKPRVDCEEYKADILSVLDDHGGKLTKAEILERGNLPASSWYPRIRELVDEGRVIREGDRGQAVYYLAERNLDLSASFS